jgi:hypothetical protein
VCNKQLKEIESTFEVVNKIDFIAAIKDHIETLALKETLQMEEKKLCDDFKDLFKPIPHVKELPPDFLVEIKLKDPRTIH